MFFYVIDLIIKNKILIVNKYYNNILQVFTVRRKLPKASKYKGS